MFSWRQLLRLGAAAALVCGAVTACSTGDQHGTAATPAATDVPQAAATPSPSLSPAKATAGCPTEAQFNHAVNAYYKADQTFPSKVFACQDGWAVGLADTPNGSGPTAIVRIVDGAWTVVSFYHHTEATCSQLPQTVRAQATGCA